VSNGQAREVLKAAGVKVGNDVLAEALRQRKMSVSSFREEFRNAGRNQWHRHLPGTVPERSERCDVTPVTLAQSRSGKNPERPGTAVTVPVPAVPPPYRAERQRNPGMIQPQWVANKINTSRRAATPDTCPKCHADVLVGDDDDRCATRVRVDATPVDRLTEAIALLAGAYSAELIGHDLHRRDDFRTQSNRHPHPIHLEHRCTPPQPEGKLF
jgi:hypothetical protein